MRYAFVQQHEATDCAAACLAMVCLHYKKEVSVMELRDRMETDQGGANLLALSRCADALGFASCAVRVDRKGFFDGFTLPAIANVMTDEGYLHFVVIYKITQDFVIVGDPAKDLLRVQADAFYETFTGALLILKPGQSFHTGRRGAKKGLVHFVRLLRPQKKLFIFSIFASFLMTALGILSSVFHHVIFDEILPNQQENKLKMAIFLLLAVILTKIAIGFVREWMLIHLSMKIDIPLMMGYFEHIYKLPMNFFSTRKTGDIITRFLDAFTVKDVFTSVALALVMDVGMAAIAGGILFWMNGKLFAILLEMTAVSAFLAILFRNPYQKLNKEQMRQASALNSRIIEGLHGMETIKGNAAEEAELEGLRREYLKTLRIGCKGDLLSKLQGILSEAVLGVGGLALLYYGVTQALCGESTLGSLAAFAVLSEYFTGPVSELLNLQHSMQEANLSIERMTEVMELQKEQEGERGQSCRKMERLEGDIAFCHVTYSYGNRAPSLKDVSFCIPQGRKVALVGESGSGKSTVVKLLLKYGAPKQGKITIGGADIKEYENASLRRAISYVPQKAELFSKSIFDNIRLGRQSASKEEVEEAAKAAGAHPFILRLPGGYGTYLEEAGGGLSGGEQQRIALARAFLKDSGLYLLDEGTSHLDPAAEAEVLEAMRQKFQNKTMLIIAHRLAAVRGCDHIIVLKQGRVVEEGSHQELLEKKGEYCRLWKLQS